MAYAVWSVVYGEQPTAAKWNILGTNDASFNDGTGIADGAIELVKLNNPYRCRAYLSAEQSNIAGSTYTKVNLDTVEYDPNGDFDNVTNYDYTVPVDGYYLINAQVRWNTASGYHYWCVIGNGTVVDAAQILGVGFDYTNATNYCTAQSTIMKYLTAGQKITLYANHDYTSATPDIIGGSGYSTFLEIALVGV